MSYRGFDVWVTQPNRVLNARESWDRGARTIENPAGRFQLESDRDAPAITRPIQWACRTRAELTAARAFLNARKGRYTAFWAPTYVEDFRFVREGSAGWNYQDLLTRGYARYVWPTAEAFRHLIAFRVDGGAVAGPWRVGRAVENGDGTDRLFEDFNNDGAGLPPFTGARWMFCVALFSRLAEDEIHWRWIRPDYAILEFSIVSLPQDTPA